jgi:hypothetical protein
MDKERRFDQHLNLKHRPWWRLMTFFRSLHKRVSNELEFVMQGP